MAGTLQHAQVGAPRADCVTILVGHHARYLMQMREVMNSPCRQEFGERHRSQFWMRSVAGQVLRLQIQSFDCSQILFTQAGELVEELLERLALTLFYLRQAVKGVEGPRFAVLLRAHTLGRPRNSASNVAGVRLRTAVVSSRLNSVMLASAGSKNS